LGRMSWHGLDRHHRHLTYKIHHRMGPLTMWPHQLAVLVSRPRMASAKASQSVSPRPERSGPMGPMILTDHPPPIVLGRQEAHTRQPSCESCSILLMASTSFMPFPPPHP